MAHNHVYGVCESKCFVEVAPLDTTTGKLKPEHLPTGVGANNIPLIKTLVAANQYLKYDVLSGGFIGAELDVAGVYTYKGTVATGSLLPTTGQAVGDVWNVEAEWQGVPAGTNWAWTGSAWDALGGSIDLSSYVTNGQMQSALADKVNATGWGSANSGKYLSVDSSGNIVAVTPQPLVEQTLGSFPEIGLNGTSATQDNYTRWYYCNPPTFNSGTRVGGNISCNYTEGTGTSDQVYYYDDFDQIDLRSILGTASGYCSISFILKCTRQGDLKYTPMISKNGYVNSGYFNTNFTIYACYTSGNTYSLLITSMTFTPS